jgi:hypothetical protein
MPTVIVAFFALGLLFGLLSYPVRHHCSEGSVRPAPRAGGLELGGRLVWAVLSSALWPVLALTGLLSWLRLARQRARSLRGRGRSPR